MRTIVIGDIHGCFREFQALLQKVKFDRESDRLILLGDVIDRGPDSALVLQECQILKRDMGERFIQLLGNHEDMMLDAYASFDRSLWNYNGGSQPGRAFTNITWRYRRFLRISGRCCFIMKRSITSACTRPFPARAWSTPTATLPSGTGSWRRTAPTAESWCFTGTLPRKKFFTSREMPPARQLSKAERSRCRSAAASALTPAAWPETS